MIKRSNMLTIISALIAFIASAAIVFDIAGEETDAFTNDGVVYEIDEETESMTVVGYEEGITEARIPSSFLIGSKHYYVESVGYKAFYGCSTLVSLSCGTDVYNRAFANCTNLEAVELTDTAYIVGECAFYGCTSLRSVSMEQSSAVIEYKAFAGCSGLEEIEFDGLQTLGIDAFGGIRFYDGTSKLSATPENLAYKRFTGSGSVLYLDLPEFEYNGVVYKPSSSSSATAIGRAEGNACIDIDQKAYCQNKTYSVTGIGDMAFYGMTDIQSVAISFSGDIGSKAFARCSGIKILTMGYVKKIGAYAFYGCTGLESVDIPATVDSIGSNAFYGNKFYAPDRTTVMPQTAEGLGGHSFTKTEGKLTCDMYVGYELVSGMVKYRMESTGKVSAFAAVGYVSGITDASIPEFLACGLEKYRVGRVAPSAFYGCLTLKNASAEATIGSKAFANCTSLTSAAIADPCRSIGDYAFYGCSALNTATFPSYVEIGALAFAKCPAFTSMSFGDVSGIGSNAFNGITFYDGTTAVQKTADNLRLREFVGEESKLYLRIPSFESRGVIYTPVSSSEAVVTGHVEGIGLAYIPSQTNYRTDSGLSYEFSVTGISKKAFYGCGTLASLTYAGTGEIGERAFANCTGLERMLLGSDASSYGPEAIGEYAFYKCPISVLEIPDTVKTIKASAFSSSGPFETVSFPDGVAIGQNAFHGTRFYAADGKTLLENTSNALAGHKFIRNDAGRLVCDMRSGDTFACGGVVYKVLDAAGRTVGATGYEEGIKNAEIPSTVSYGGLQFTVEFVMSKAFYGCGTLESLHADVPILSKAFANCTSLTSVVLEDGCASVDDYAFYGCSGLRTVEFPSEVDIGASSFARCPSVARMSFGHIGTAMANALTGIGFYDGDSVIQPGPFTLAFREFTGEGSVLRLKLPAFMADSIEYTPISSSEALVTGHADGIRNASIPATVSDSTHPALGYNTNVYAVAGIADRAFYKCQTLTSLSYAGNGAIGDRAFANCTSLTDVTISEGLGSIGEYAFYKCPVSELELPGTMETIGASAFSSCGSFKVVDIPGSVTAVGANAFYGTKFYAIDGETQVTATVDSLSGNRYVQNDAGRLVGGLFDGCRFSYGGAVYQVVDASSGTVDVIGPAEGATEATIPMKFTIGGTACAVGSMKAKAFYGCGGLRSVSVDIDISSKAFANCVSLEEISLGPVSVGDYAFYGCPNVMRAEFGSLTGIGVNAFGGFTFYDWTTALRHTVENLSDNTFAGASSRNLVRLVMEGEEFFVDGLKYTVTSVDPWEASLTGVDPNGGPDVSVLNVPATVEYYGETLSVTSIGGGAFDDNPDITELNLDGSNVKRIGIGAFMFCPNLRKVMMEDSCVEYMSSSVFYECASECREFEVHFPSTLTHIGVWALYGTPVTVLETNSDLEVDLLLDKGIFDYYGNALTDMVPSGLYVAYAPDDDLTQQPREGDVVSVGDLECTISQGTLVVTGSVSGEISIDTGIDYGFGNENFLISEIADKAFENSQKIQRLGIYGYSMNFNIGNEAFKGCPNLEYVELNGDVMIGSKAFAYCNGLGNLTCADGPLSSCSDSFEGIEIYNEGVLVDTSDVKALRNISFVGEDGKLYGR